MPNWLYSCGNVVDQVVSSLSIMLFVNITSPSIICKTKDKIDPNRSHGKFFMSQYNKVIFLGTAPTPIFGHIYQHNGSFGGSLLSLYVCKYIYIYECIYENRGYEIREIWPFFHLWHWKRHICSEFELVPSGLNALYPLLFFLSSSGFLRNV